MKEEPKISVVMTVFNGERFLKDAIDSILNQTFKDFEFIIVDNASTDGTKRIISSYRDPRIILIENEQNFGQTKALNIGIKQSRGQFIARMDADEISLPQRLEFQYKFLIENKSISVVGTWYEKIDKNGKHLRYYSEPIEPLEIKCYLISPGQLGYYCIAHSTVLMRRDVLFEVGLYNENFRTQDYDLWLRIVKKYKIANLNKFLLKHRIQAKQQSREFKSDIEFECEKIIISNILYYLPRLKNEELMPLARMLQYKPQKTKEDGLKVLDIFNLFFKKYLNGSVNNKLAKKAQAKMELFYLLQLLRTNTIYSLQKLLKIIFKNTNLLFDQKLYKKVTKILLSFFEN